VNPLLKLAQNRLPPQHRAKVLLGARLFAPKEARRLGLLDDISEQAEAEAVSVLEGLEAHPRGAYAESKADLRSGTMDISEREQRTFHDEVLPLWTSGELKQRLAGWLKPKR